MNDKARSSGAPDKGNSIRLPGCRHDILGHHLKAWGILRALHKCAPYEHLDHESEGWWDLDQACFCLRSSKYDSIEKLAEFLGHHYQPSKVISPWDKDIGYKTSPGSPPHEDDLRIARSLSGRIPATSGATIKRANFIEFRDEAISVNAYDLDSLASIFMSRNSDNPVFLNRGAAGRAQMFRTYWEYIQQIEKERNKRNGGKTATIAEKSTLGSGSQTGTKKGRGSPFFPDAIKTYNNGSSWVVESFPFNALDYILAVEGALALRGSASRTLAANSRRFAAFPFIVETGDDMTDDSGEIKGTAKALWLPLWDRPVSYSELASFVSDAQSRLPGKEAKFSSEFARSLRSQGVDAGFAAWQEFRYKMKASRIPWVCTGNFIGREASDRPLLLTDALSPLDESAFLDQFIEKWKGAKIEASSPHHYRERVNAAIESAIISPTPENALEILAKAFEAVKQLAMSKNFRDKTHGAHFFRPLPQEPWNALLSGLDASREFLIARALASMTGREKQPNGKDSEVQPMLGSILPLKLGSSGWYLWEQSPQAVWTGYDLYHDLSKVLQRRYLDSLFDQLPALRSVHPAPLDAVLALLQGDLDNHQISRWTEALSLIGWHHQRKEDGSSDEGPKAANDDRLEPWHPVAIPPAYAALRGLLEVECEWQGANFAIWQKRRSRIPFALLCQRTPGAVSRAVSESLHRLSIWGVINPDKESRNESQRLQGKSIIRPQAFQIQSDEASRLAAVVCVPLVWKDQSQLYWEITIPTKTQTKEPAL
ncbi:MAG: type I-U CRISPR-associated protein Csx17 [Opitutales bacterium]|nr:type I-U CRISPR-associated protein Csx17 [Opitutales bacterium]